MLTALILSLPALAIERCDHGVSFSNGATTRNLTAKVTCRDDATGELTRVVDLRNGEEHGLEIRYDNGVKRWEQRYSNGRRNGVSTYFSKGVLSERRTYVDGRTKGLQTRYHPDGSVRSQTFEEADGRDSRWSFLENGALEGLVCGDTPIDDRHAALCNGDEPVVLHHGNGNVESRGRFRKGKLHGEIIEYHRDGKTKRRQGTWVDGEEEGRNRTWRADGTLETDFTWSSGRKVTADRYHADGKTRSERWAFDDDGVTVYEAFWQNGETKERREVVDADTMRLTTFDDAGRRASSGDHVLRHCRGPGICAGRATGEHLTFDAKGRKTSLNVYVDGVLTESTTFDGKGRPSRRERYHPDGSRKR